jgi:hypothetical protein
MTPLDDNEIIDPHSFIKNFPDLDAFREWTRQAETINDLRSILTKFEKAELYEYATIIQVSIDEKVDRMLSGLGFEIDS